jgi:hypothetical protein
VVVARVFISYATPDRAIADEVSSWLRAAGHEPFLAHDLRNGTGAGEGWKQRLYDELREVDAVIGVMTSSFAASAWCSVEFGAGDHANHRISPTQPLMQPPLPLLTDRDPIMQIVIQKHLMTLAHQPLVQSTGTLTVIIGMTDEYPGHPTSQTV